MNKYTGGVSLLGWLFLIMFALKLLGKISFSWWLVTLPLWGPLAIAMVITFGAALWFLAKDSKGIYK